MQKQVLTDDEIISLSKSFYLSLTSQHFNADLVARDVIVYMRGYRNRTLFKTSMETVSRIVRNIYILRETVESPKRGSVVRKVAPPKPLPDYDFSPINSFMTVSAKSKPLYGY